MLDRGNPQPRMVVILGGMVMLGLCALFYRSALGSSKELRIMNLGKVPEAPSFSPILPGTDGTTVILNMAMPCTSMFQ